MQNTQRDRHKHRERTHQLHTCVMRSHSSCQCLSAAVGGIQQQHFSSWMSRCGSSLSSDCLNISKVVLSSLKGGLFPALVFWLKPGFTRLYATQTPPPAMLLNWISFCLNLCFKTSNYFLTPEEARKQREMSQICTSHGIWRYMILHQPKGHKPEAQQFTNHSSVSKLNHTTFDIF